VLLSAKALFHTGFFRTIDDATVVRVTYLYKELLKGNFLHNFPVRMSSELSNNFGYPLYMYYAPLSYYAGALMMIAKLSHIVATKYIYVFPLLTGPFFFYWAARQKISTYPAVIASILFTFFPYRGYDTYIKGGVAEAWSIAFLPLIIGSLFLLQNKNKWGMPLLAISLFLTVFSHQLIGVMAICAALLYGFIYLRRDPKFWIGYLTGIGSLIFYIVPLLWYLNIVHASILKENSLWILTNSAPIQEFFLIRFPFNPDDKSSALLTYIFLASSAYFLISGFFLKKKVASEIYLLIGAGVASFLLMSQPFLFFWKYTMSVTSLLQFPWRLLVVLSVVIPLLAGFWLDSLKNVYMKGFVAVILIAISLSFLPVFQPKEYSYYYNYEPTAPCATASHQNEYLPLWVTDCPTARPPLEVSKNSVLSITKDTGLEIQADLTQKKASDLVVNKYFFPGWKLYVDGKKTDVTYNFSDYGIFKTTVPAGTHHITVRYEKTAVMWISDIISLLSVGYLAYMILQILRIKKR
jgi:hypothetical protein